MSLPALDGYIEAWLLNKVNIHKRCFASIRWRWNTTINNKNLIHQISILKTECRKMQSRYEYQILIARRVFKITNRRDVLYIKINPYCNWINCFGGAGMTFIFWGFRLWDRPFNIIKDHINISISNLMFDLWGWISFYFWFCI